MDADIARHAVPEPSDGELYLLKIPRFLAIEPTAFNHKTFQAPTTDHHWKTAPSEHFSAFNTAMTTIRWRRSPSKPSQLQSNARVLRWSDGSLTLQFANDPVNQYQVNANALAPPQVDPKIPTPTSVKKKTRTEFKESYTYLVAPYEEANVMRVTNKFTTGIQVVPAANSRDGALEKLQNDLAAAAARGRDDANQAISFINVNEDPELRRQREEQSYKEKLKQQRAREKHELRERERANRTFNRSGVHRSTYGLDVGMLEGEERGRRPGAKKARLKASQRDWSSDEDYGIRGRPTREDEYDEEDDFIAPSEEEPEIVDDDEDDDGIIEEPRHRARDTQSPKRNRDGDEDEDEEVIVNRPKRRRVVEDDDEDE